MDSFADGTGGFTSRIQPVAEQILLSQGIATQVTSRMANMTARGRCGKSDLELIAHVLPSALSLHTSHSLVERCVILPAAELDVQSLF